MSPAENLSTDIVSRLNILIALFLEQPPPQPRATIADKIRRLTHLGIAPSETARILGKPVNYVTASLSSRKAPKKEALSGG